MRTFTEQEVESLLTKTVTEVLVKHNWSNNLATQVAIETTQQVLSKLKIEENLDERVWSVYKILLQNLYNFRGSPSRIQTGIKLDLIKLGFKEGPYVEDLSSNYEQLLSLSTVEAFNHIKQSLIDLNEIV